MLKCYIVVLHDIVNTEIGNICPSFLFQKKKDNVKVEEKKKADTSKNGIGAAMPAAVSKTDDAQNKKMADEVNMYKKQAADSKKQAADSEKKIVSFRFK